MDTLSHALWGKGLFGYRGNPWLALFFGAMPGPFFIWNPYYCTINVRGLLKYDWRRTSSFGFNSMVGIH